MVELPRERSLVGCKWVFTIKYKAMVLLRDTKSGSLSKAILKHMSRLPKDFHTRSQDEHYESFTLFGCPI